jgi:hypothetical protein
MGSPEGDYACVGPNRRGRLPAEFDEDNTFRMPTNMVWLIGRVYSDGSEADIATLLFDIPWVPPPVDLVPWRASQAACARSGPLEL